MGQWCQLSGWLSTTYQGLTHTIPDWIKRMLHIFCYSFWHILMTAIPYPGILWHKSINDRRHYICKFKCWCSTGVTRVQNLSCFIVQSCPVRMGAGTLGEYILMEIDHTMMGLYCSLINFKWKQSPLPSPERSQFLGTPHLTPQHCDKDNNQAWPVWSIRSHDQV